jgi:two-component system CheB/CheR fusion protein
MLVDRASDGRVLKITWRERGGPPVRQHATSGLGSMPIESGLPDAPVRRVQREFDPAGLVCTHRAATAEAFRQWQ